MAASFITGKTYFAVKVVKGPDIIFNKLISLDSNQTVSHALNEFDIPIQSISSSKCGDTVIDIMTPVHILKDLNIGQSIVLQ